MKKLSYLLALAALLCSCGPMRVSTNIMKSYSSFPIDEPVEVYYHSGEVPSDSEALGTVRAADSGTTATAKCDSLTAVEHLKGEARKVGGNAVYVSTHIKPSFWGSSCHQMEGTILRVYDFDSAPGDEEAFENQDRYSDEVIMKKKRTMPRMALGVDLGYGWRTAENNGETSVTRDYMGKLMRGPAFGGSFVYYFSNFGGIGLTYSALTGSTGNGFVYTENGTTHSLKGNSLLNYAGIDYAMLVPLGDKWLMDLRLGIGYADYRITDKIGNGDYFKQWGSTVGTHYRIGVNYSLSESFAIALDLSSQAGLVGTIHYDDNGYKSKEKINDTDYRIGLGQIRVSLGVRYFFR